MTEQFALQPWDDAAMARDLLDLVLELPRVRLSDMRDAPRMPAAYLQFFATTRVEPILDPLVASGRLCAYAGVANDARERLSRYKISIQAIDAFDEDDLYIALLPCASTASARFCEAALIESLDPPLQKTGWGNRVQGGRRHSRTSPTDALFAKRSAPAASPVDTARARLLLLSNLTRRDPNGPRWPALVPEGEQRSAYLRLAQLGGPDMTGALGVGQS